MSALKNGNSGFEFAQIGVFFVLQKGLKDCLALKSFLLYDPVTF